MLVCLRKFRTTSGEKNGMQCPFPSNKILDVRSFVVHVFNLSNELYNTIVILLFGMFRLRHEVQRPSNVPEPVCSIILLA